MEKQKCPEIRFNQFNENWSIISLGDLMNVGSVKRVHQADWCDTGVRFLRARDIVAFAKNEDIADPIYISQDRYEEYSKLSGKVKVGDLLVTGVGTIGVPMLVGNDDPLYFKDGNVIWFKNENAINGLFLYYSFINKTIQNFIKDSAGIGTVGTYTITSGKRTPIYLPKENEQIQIGNFFQNLDQSIALHEKKLSQTQNLKKAMLEKMFPKAGSMQPEIRLKGFSGDWVLSKIGEVFHVTSGGTPLRSDLRFFENADIDWVKTTDLNNGIINKTEEKISSIALAETSIKILPKGTVFVAMYGGFNQIGRTGLLVSDATCNQALSAIYPNDKVEPYYLLTYLNFKVDSWKDLAASSRKDPNITKSDVLSFPLMYPSVKEQFEISHFFKKLDETLTLQQQQLQTLKNLKQAFLEKMFV